jgi:eukaryotic-like serine/threonine-protein kinase
VLNPCAMDASQTDETLVPNTPSGALLGGKYRLLRCLGKGGMGEVWEAEHAKLERRVAIKFIHAEAAHDVEVLRRFCNEARASAKLQSRFIVQVMDDGVTSDGRPYIVMEKLTGESLGDRLARVGRLEPEQVRGILKDVCRGLGIAHEAGIVHRDLKPDNIFLHRDPDDDSETAKIVDFGVARLSEKDGEASPSLTQTGSLLGTPVYMSPEQTRGAKPIDLRSDLWALGVIAHECLTGELPFDGRALVDLFIQICVEPQAPPSMRRPELPMSIDAWMARALAKDKQQRFMSAAEMFASFERALGYEPGPASVVSLQGSLPSASRPSGAGLRADLPTLAGSRPTQAPSSDGAVEWDAPAPSAADGRGRPRRAAWFVLATMTVASLLLVGALARGRGGEQPPVEETAAASRGEVSPLGLASGPEERPATPERPASAAGASSSAAAPAAPPAPSSRTQAAPPARSAPRRAKVLSKGTGSDDLGY